MTFSHEINTIIKVHTIPWLWWAAGGLMREDRGEARDEFRGGAYRGGGDRGGAGG